MSELNMYLCKTTKIKIFVLLLALYFPCIIAKSDEHALQSESGSKTKKTDISGQGNQNSLMDKAGSGLNTLINKTTTEISEGLRYSSSAIKEAYSNYGDIFVPIETVLTHINEGVKLAEKIGYKLEQSQITIMTDSEIILLFKKISEIEDEKFRAIKAEASSNTYADILLTVLHKVDQIRLGRASVQKVMVIIGWKGLIPEFQVKLILNELNPISPFGGSFNWD